MSAMIHLYCKIAMQNYNLNVILLELSSGSCGDRRNEKIENIKG
jgi:hypothetical protein